ncbi:MAG TPA: HAMP domain-containing sensor histidine kinase, partial [Bacteroidia bacterium]
LLEIGKSIANISELDSTIKKFSLIIMLFILSITVLIDVGYAKYLLKPFQQIIEKKLNAVKHPGDYDAREIYTTTSDFRYLDKSINEMMEKVNLAFLREKEFTSNVSHELLTPISLLQSRLENILSDENISEQTTLKVIESQRTLSRLNKIITALLMISRIEHEQYLKDESVNIRQLINEVIDEIEERLVEKKIKIDFRCEADYNFQHANKSLLFILVFNLVNNAIKYNIENGQISILTRNDHGKFMIEVSDTGIGIAPEKISSLFDRFKKHKVTNEQSYGLGLPIVKAIADFHSVEIKIFSQLGKGTKFQLIIPFQ